MRNLSTLLIGMSLVTLTVAASTVYAAEHKSVNMKVVEQGRYLVKITGCNDCHTSGYAQTGGNVPEKLWLTGDQLGWHGPWGTTYATNLRLFMQTMSEAEWVKTAHTAKYRPPMPWFALHEMKTADLKAIYQFIRYLGPAGQAAPAYLRPDQEPRGPFVVFPRAPKKP